MSVLRITKEFRFEGAHALPAYDGKCRNIHGHSYILYVTIKGSPVCDPDSPKNGMVVDFKVLKKIVNENVVDVFDHALVLRNDNPLLEALGENYPNIVAVDFQPTTENLICYFAEKIAASLPEGVELFSLKLHETASSFVEWYAADNK